MPKRHALYDSRQIQDGFITKHGRKLFFAGDSQRFYPLFVQLEVLFKDAAIIFIQGDS